MHLFSQCTFKKTQRLLLRAPWNCAVSELYMAHFRVVPKPWEQRNCTISEAALPSLGKLPNMMELKLMVMIITAVLLHSVKVAGLRACLPAVPYHKLTSACLTKPGFILVSIMYFFRFCFWAFYCASLLNIVSIC